jgi:hypothetical protein
MVSRPVLPMDLFNQVLSTEKRDAFFVFTGPALSAIPNRVLQLVLLRFTLPKSRKDSARIHATKRRVKHSSHTRLDVPFSSMRCDEQELHTTEPHERQWCLRIVQVNLTLQ